MKLELPADKKLVFQMTLPVRWGDMDAMGHVNNTLYFRYLETVRIDWFRSIGVPVLPEGEGMLIVNAFCNFHRMLTFPADILVKMYVSAPGRSSFETWNTIERTDEPGVFYATGGATTVWLDIPKQKAAPLPDWVRAHLV